MAKSTNLRQPFNPERVVSQMMSRYFLRLEEAVAETDPDLSIHTILLDAGVRTPEQAGYRSMSDFLDAVKAILNARHIDGLGLRFGTRIRLSDCGLAGLAMATCPTIRDSLYISTARLPILSPTEEVYLETTTERGSVIMRFREFHPELWTEHYLIEQEVAIFLAAVHELLPDANYQRRCRVKLAYPRPSHWRLYEQLLGCPVTFRQQEHQVIFPESWLEERIKSADPELSRILDEQCQVTIGIMGEQGGWVDLVRRMLLRSTGKPPTLNQASDRLGIPVHTLRRRLYQAGTTYKQIVYSVRMELAADYLRDTTLTLQEIVFLLGYDHAPNFFSAFKKYWGVSPNDYRHQS